MFVSKVEYIVSEWGFLTEFEAFTEAVCYCIDNYLTDGEQGLLWIHSRDCKELMVFINSDYADHEYMRFKWEGEPKNYIWDHTEEIWTDCTEIEIEGESDFDEYYEGRKIYIDAKYQR